MFGYHDSNRCSADLWSPVTTDSYSPNADPQQEGYGVWEDTPYHTAIENRAFSAYAFHTQRLDDIAERIATTQGTITVSDDITEEDLAYITRRLNTVYGLDVELSLNS